MAADMLEKIRNFLRNMTTGDGGNGTLDADDPRLCAAAILVHIIAVDGVVDEAEKTRLHQVLQTNYELDDKATATLIEEAKKRAMEAVDLYGFTSILKRQLDVEGRRKIVEMMWEMVFADGEVHEFEDNTVWRVTELLAIPTSDRLALRRRVARRVNYTLEGDTLADEPEASEN